MSQTFIIQGVDSQGHIFRPTDWADRLAGRLCKIQMRRLRYSPYLYPTVHEGYRSLHVDGMLIELYPELYADLKAFSLEHHLVIILLE